MSQIEIRDASFTYPSRSEPSLKKINAEIERGEFILLTGPTGCGKSTLLRTLNGLIPHASGGVLSGNVTIDDTNLADQPLAVICQHVGLLFQNPDDQFFCTVVEDEIAFGLENLGVRSFQIDARIDTALTQVKLPSGFRARAISTLSGGEKQRVALACLCAMQPRILLLDEPTSHLDPTSTCDILEILRQLNRENEITVVIATHRVAEIAPLCDRVWLMNHAEIALDSPVDRAFSDLSSYRNLGVEVPDLAEISEQLGLPERPLTVDQAVQIFMHADRFPSKSAPISNLSGLASHDQSHQDSRNVLASIENLTFQYPRTAIPALSDVSFEISKGEVIAIMGANGSGKTTLLLSVPGLLRPTTGRILIADVSRERLKLHNLAGKIGIVFQDPDLLLQAATVSDEVAYGPKNLKLSRYEIEERTEEVMSAFDLDSLGNEAPYSLSRGQRQRTATAAAYSLLPNILLLDEPTAGQDFSHLQRLMGVLCDTVEKQNKTLMFCTHDAQLTLQYAKRMLLLRQGELIFDGKPSDAFSNPDLLEYASLIAPLKTQLKWRLANSQTNLTCR
jgi:energy-coupling factor transporter ATP-binding protein EcfA2